MRRLKKWLAPFIRECLLSDCQSEELKRLVTCLSCARANLVGSRYCSGCGKPFLAKKANFTYRVQDTDPIGALQKVVPPSPQQPANTIAPASQRLRPFLGYVKKYRHGDGASGSAPLAQRDGQENRPAFR